MDLQKSRIIFSIIIPVLHESARINYLIKHLNELDSKNISEIIVVDGCEKKDTIKSVKDKNVKLITSKKGRAKQMNEGAKIANGEILIFLHADTELPPNAFGKIDEFIKKGKCVAGAFKLLINSDRFIFKIISKLISIRSVITRVPYGDQAIFVRKDYFQQIGGFRNIQLMEDIDLMKRIKRYGDRICIIPEHVCTSARRWEKEGILRCTFRNWMIRFLYYLGVSPSRLIKFYK